MSLLRAMDLPCAHWQNYVGLKWNSLDNELKNVFTSLQECDDLFDFGLSQTTEEDLDFLLSVSKDYPVQKDPVQAARCRERGNASFKTRGYTAAALHYSRGVCFATKSSEQLSLCYANRSAALYHLQHFQESLDDIDRALKHGYPSHLQYKLQERRLQCKHHLSWERNTKSTPSNPGSSDHKGPGNGGRPNVNAQHNINLSFCMSPEVEIRFSPDKGRHLVATESVAAGKMILKDKAYSCVLMPGMQELKGKESRKHPEQVRLFGTEDRFCHWCLGETLSPVPCETCGYSRYCSDMCRQEAWAEHHCWECPIGAELRALGVMSQLAFRVALKAGLKSVQRARETVGDRSSSPRETTNTSPVLPSNGSDPNNSPSLHNDVADPSALHYVDSYLSIYNLLHHLSCQSPGMRFLCAVTVAVLYLKLSRAGPPPVSWDLRGSIVKNSQSQGIIQEEPSSDWSLEQRLLGSVVLRHLLQLRCNGQAVSKLQDTGVTESAVQSSQEIRIAAAIFPTLSVLNHSCRPNTSIDFSAGPSSAFCSQSIQDPSSGSVSSDGVSRFTAATCGTTVTVRAAKAIAPGQEILHCYGPHSSRMGRQERRRLLQDQYYFLCQCEACKQQAEEEESKVSLQGSGPEGQANCTRLHCEKCKGPLKECTGSGFVCPQSVCHLCVSHSDLSQRLQKIRGHLDEAVDLMERDRPGDALRVLKRAESISRKILTKTHPLQGELADAMARSYASMGDWKCAASQLERSVAAIGAQYGEDSIELGRQLFKLTQLHFNGGSPGPVMSLIPRVRKLLSLHCGPEGPELQELQAMEDCIRG